MTAATAPTTAWFHCFAGIAGDMALGALVDAGADLEEVCALLRRIPVGGWKIDAQPVLRGGIAATRLVVHTAESPVVRTYAHITGLIDEARLPDRVRDRAQATFLALAQTEGRLHRRPPEQVHFHEVGGLDAIVDIVGTCAALETMGVDRVCASPVATGTGMVRSAHGVLPNPAPAVVELLRGAPTYGRDIAYELTTPTGAAILTTVVQQWIEQPVMTIERIGHGAGRREFVEQPNLLRLFVGTAATAPQSDQVWMLETNLDDLPAEVIGYCYDLLLAAGALDVFGTPIFMKKNRPGVLLSVLAPETKLAELEEILFRETATFGIRRYPVTRNKLNRRPCTVSTPWGPLRGKLGWQEGRPPIFAPEYEDCARVARQHAVPLREVYLQAQRAYLEQAVQE